MGFPKTPTTVTTPPGVTETGAAAKGILPGVDPWEQADDGTIIPEVVNETPDHDCAIETDLTRFLEEVDELTPDLLKLANDVVPLLPILAHPAGILTAATLYAERALQGGGNVGPKKMVLSPMDGAPKNIDIGEADILIKIFLSQIATRRLFISSDGNPEEIRTQELAKGISLEHDRKRDAIVFRVEPPRNFSDTDIKGMYDMASAMLQRLVERYASKMIEEERTLPKIDVIAPSNFRSGGILPAEISYQDPAKNEAGRFMANMNGPFSLSTFALEGGIYSKELRPDVKMVYDPSNIVKARDGTTRGVVGLIFDPSAETIADEDLLEERVAGARISLMQLLREFEETSAELPVITPPIIEIRTDPRVEHTALLANAILEEAYTMLYDLNEMRLEGARKLTGKENVQDIYDTLEEVHVSWEQYRKYVAPAIERSLEIKKALDSLALGGSGRMGREISGLWHDHNNTVGILQGFNELWLPKVGSGKPLDMRALFPPMDVASTIRSVSNAYISRAGRNEMVIHIPSSVEMQGQLERKLGKRQIAYLERVIKELVLNAIDHSEGKNVWVRAGYGGSGLVYVEVTDDGKGMDAATLATYGLDREAPDLVTKRIRTHFGTKNVIDLIERLGGIHEVTSSPKGTSFRFLLPFDRLIDTEELATDVGLIFVRAGNRIADFGYDSMLRALSGALSHGPGVGPFAEKLQGLSPSQNNRILTILMSREKNIDEMNEILGSVGLKLTRARRGAFMLGSKETTHINFPKEVSFKDEAEKAAIEELMVWTMEKSPELINYETEEIRQLSKYSKDPFIEDIYWVAGDLLRRDHDKFQTFYRFISHQPKGSPLSIAGFESQLPPQLVELYRILISGTTVEGRTFLQANPVEPLLNVVDELTRDHIGDNGSKFSMKHWRLRYIAQKLIGHEMDPRKLASISPENLREEFSWMLNAHHAHISKNGVAAVLNRLIIEATMNEKASEGTTIFREGNAVDTMLRRFGLMLRAPNTEFAAAFSAPEDDETEWNWGVMVGGAGRVFVPPEFDRTLVHSHAIDALPSATDIEGLSIGEVGFIDAIRNDRKLQTALYTPLDRRVALVKSNIQPLPHSNLTSGNTLHLMLAGIGAFAGILPQTSLFGAVIREISEYVDPMLDVPPNGKIEDGVMLYAREKRLAVRFRNGTELFNHFNRGIYLPMGLVQKAITSHESVKATVLVKEIERYVDITITPVVGDDNFVSHLTVSVDLETKENWEIPNIPLSEKEDKDAAFKRISEEQRPNPRGKRWHQR